MKIYGTPNDRLIIKKKNIMVDNIVSPEGSVVYMNYFTHNVKQFNSTLDTGRNTLHFNTGTLDVFYYIDTKEYIIREHFYNLPIVIKSDINNLSKCLVIIDKIKKIWNNAYYDSLTKPKSEDYYYLPFDFDFKEEYILYPFTLERYYLINLLTKQHHSLSPVILKPFYQLDKFFKLLYCILETI